MKQNFVIPILVLTVICLVVSGALAVMDSFTAPIISEANAQRAAEAMNAKIPHAEEFELIDIVGLGLPQYIKEVYRTTNDVGYIFIAAKNGFSGDITVICAINNDGRIIATSTLSHTETVGIGTVIEDEKFLNPFSGIDQDNLGNIDTITGATISTRAYIEIIREIFAAYHIIVG